MTSIDDAMRAAAELRDAGNLLRRGAQAQLVDLRDVALAYRGDRPVWVVSRPAGPDAYSKLFPEAGGRDPALKMVAERRQVPDPRGKHPIFRHERTVTHSAWRLQVPTVPDAIFRSLDEIRPDPVIQGQLSAAAEAARSAEEGRQLGGLFMQSTKAHIRDVLDAGT